LDKRGVEIAAGMAVCEDLVCLFVLASRDKVAGGFGEE
jgi:hypothetical protein